MGSLTQFDLILVAALGLTGISLPGHVSRYRRYRTRADLVFFGTALMIALACGWSLLQHWTGAAWPIALEVACWVAAAILSFLAFAEIRAGRQNLLHRTRGLRVGERIAFFVGFAGMGNPPVSAEERASGSEEPPVDRPGGLADVTLMLFVTVLGLTMVVAVAPEAGAWPFTLGLIGLLIILGQVYCRRAWHRNRDAARARAAQQPDRCPECGYRLRGLPETRCPECGRPFRRPETTQSGQSEPMAFSPDHSNEASK